MINYVKTKIKSYNSDLLRDKMVDINEVCLLGIDDIVEHSL